MLLKIYCPLLRKLIFFTIIEIQVVTYFQKEYLISNLESQITFRIAV